MKKPQTKQLQPDIYDVLKDRIEIITEDNKRKKKVPYREWIKFVNRYPDHSEEMILVKQKLGKGFTYEVIRSSSALQHILYCEISKIKITFLEWMRIDD